MEQAEEIEGFHHSARGDVYDLYNACNGVMQNGLLDVRMLDELSPEERRTLNVPRLKEIWAHTASGCLRCRKIIEILNACRGTMRVGNGG